VENGKTTALFIEGFGSRRQIVIMKQQLIDKAKELWKNHSYTFHLSVPHTEKELYFRITHILFFRYGVSRYSLQPTWKGNIEFK
jgi:hypothetical protein